MLVHDEVCGMTIESKGARASVVFQGKRYHFCSDRCRRKFEAHPERYVPIEEDAARTPAHDHH